MRLRLTLKDPQQGRVVLPTNYNYLIQAAIYRNISRELAEFLHDKGFLFGKRQFKMFTFSRLEGRCLLDKKDRRFIYEGDLTLYISSLIKNLSKILQIQF